MTTSNYTNLSATETNITFACLRCVATGEIILEDKEYHALLGIDFKTLEEVVSAVPDLDESQMKCSLLPTNHYTIYLPILTFTTQHGRTTSQYHNVDWLAYFLIDAASYLATASSQARNAVQQNIRANRFRLPIHLSVESRSYEARILDSRNESNEYGSIQPTTGRYDNSECSL